MERGERNLVAKSTSRSSERSRPEATVSRFDLPHDLTALAIRPAVRRSRHGRRIGSHFRISRRETFSRVVVSRIWSHRKEDGYRGIEPLSTTPTTRSLNSAPEVIEAIHSSTQKKTAVLDRFAQRGLLTTHVCITVSPFCHLSPPTSIESESETETRERTDLLSGVPDVLPLTPEFLQSLPLEGQAIESLVVAHKLHRVGARDHLEFFENLPRSRKKAFITAHLCVADRRRKRISSAKTSRRRPPACPKDLDILLSAASPAVQLDGRGPHRCPEGPCS